MKSRLVALSFSLALVAAAAATNDVVTAKLAEKAELVIRGKRLTAGEGVKYVSYQVQVIQVLKNTSDAQVDHELHVTAYYGQGPPEGESAFYLQRYAKNWKLVGFRASEGISHNKK